MATTLIYTLDEAGPSGGWLRTLRPTRQAANSEGMLIVSGKDRHPRIGLTPRPLLVALLLSALTACGAPLSSAPDTIVVLASATANEPAPVLAANDRNDLTAAGNDSTDGTAYVVNPNTGQATVVSLTPRRPDGQVQNTQPQRTNMIAGYVARVQRVLDGQAATQPFDLLSMISAAVRASPTPGTLIVLSSGLSTAGGMDMRLVGWNANPAIIAAQLKQRRLLPNLTGWNVVFSGLANTAARQPALPLPERTIVSEYWMAICRTAGAATCHTDDMTRPEPPSRSTVPVPVVPVPVVTSVRGPHGWTGSSLPDDEFFQFNSARLRAGADAVLGQLAARARATDAQVSVTGYASPDAGSAAYNTALSQARAQAVRDRLIALGVSPGQIVQVRGLGTDGRARSACLVRGQLDEAICAKFRRVVVLLSTSSAATS